MKISKKTFSSLRTSTRKNRALLQKRKTNLQTAIAALAKTGQDLKKERAKGSKAKKRTIGRLEARQKTQQTRVAGLRDQVSTTEASISRLVDRILVSTDPRDQVENMDDAYPLFLMPIRVETRFMTVKHITRIDRKQVGEIGGIGEIKIVDGRPVTEAVRLSVSDIFENRTTLPVIEDVHELWIRIFPDDIHAHTHENLLTATEIKAAQTFWTHIWYAADNESLRIGAWRGLVASRGPERAAWIAKQMEPTNPADKPATEIDPETSLPIDPVFPSPGTKEGSWSQAPHSRVLPDRFVARLYSGSSHREVVGELIPDNLQLGLDPQASEDEITSENGKLDMSEKLLWMKDFEEAEKVGMAIRVPLLLKDRILGFDKIFVLGVKTSSDENEGQALLEELLNNHHYTHGGLSLVPQGTPTNNTEDAKSGYTAFNSDEEYLFDLELNKEQFTPTTNDKKKTDGQHLAETLGISNDIFQHVDHADGTDIKEAMCMNRALWPTTLGYYLSQMMHPVFSSADIIKTRSHFNQFVLGRGRTSAIRIDDQPYGILPTTAFSKWNYSSSSDTTSRFLDKMHRNVLKNMEVTWDNLAQQLKFASGDTNISNYHELFLDVMGLHASSVEFYQRFVSGPYFLWNLYNYSNVIKNGGFVSPAPASYATSLDFLQLYGAHNYIFSFPPRLFDFFYVKDHKYLNGPVIDPLKLSETRSIKPIGSNGENYIDWLIKSDWNQIKSENFYNIGAGGATPPNSLLYLMLRHSTLLEYVRTSVNILVKEGILTNVAQIDTELLNLGVAGQINIEAQNLVRAQVSFDEGLKMEKKIEKKVEKEFKKRADKGLLDDLDLEGVTHARAAFKAELKEKEAPIFEKNVAAGVGEIITGYETSINKIEALTSNYEFLKGVSMVDYIDKGLLKTKVNQDLLELKELVEALECLKDVPTARLERCFAEHIDLSNYRLDAWFYSLVSQRLNKLRKSGSASEKGVFIGSYAWLENLRPGRFPGIHYREVEIQPDIVVVPGFRDVSLEAEQLIGKVTPVDPWVLNRGLQLDLDIIKAAKKKPAKKKAKKSKVTAARFINRDSTANIYGNLALMTTGGATLSVTEMKEQISVEMPLLLAPPTIRDLGPQYSYLGSGRVGDITYDFVSNKFIHQPRVDPTNQGYIHAPSLNHATTAAVLRAGYEAHNSGSANNKLAVNLSSNRVRQAMYYTEGMKNGQELGALLGYQFERGLHDRDTGLDQYILEIRMQYPLVANRVTDSSGATSITSAEAYNVVNGLELVENSRDPSGDYPYGVTGLPNFGTSKTAIIEEVTRMHDALDAINDLLMSESMYQVVQGNYARASGALNAMSGKSVVVNPEVVKTPRNFHVLSHRMGIQFDLSAGGHNTWTSAGTPRSIAEPHLNRWLGEMLPDKDKILISFEYQFIVSDGSEGSFFEDSASMADLNIEPIDLYYILTQPSEKGDAVELVDRVGFYIRKEVQKADNLNIQIAFTDRSSFTADEVSLYELQPLIDQLKSVVSSSRPLKAQDFLLSTGSEDVIAANPTKGLDTSPLLARLNDVIALNMSNGERGLAGVVADLQAEILNIETLVASTGVGGGVVDPLAALRTALINAAFFGAQNAIPQTAIEASEEIAEELLLIAARALAELEPRLTDATTDLANAVAATTENKKLADLNQAAQQLFGRAFKVFPEYELYNEGAYDAALSYPDYLNDAGPFAVEEWMQGLSPVRKRIHAYHEASLLSQVLKNSDTHLSLSLAQLPLEPLDDLNNVVTRWLGVEFSEDYEMPDENISFVFQTYAGHTASGLQAGIIIDDWVEEIPEKIAHTGVAVHYNNPNSEPPQTCLLAVSPNLSGNWSWDDMMDTLYDTLEWSKKRAVDPDLLNQTFYAQILPATYAAVSATGNTPTLDYGRNIVKKPKPGFFGMLKVQDFKIRDLDLNFKLFP